MSGNLKSAFLYNDRTNQYYLLASSVVFYYDFSLTISQEIQHIWSTNFTFVNVLIMALRYITAFGYIPTLVLTFSPAFASEEKCNNLGKLPGIIGIVCQGLTLAFLIIRIYAIFNKKRWVLFATVPFGLLNIILSSLAIGSATTVTIQEYVLAQENVLTLVASSCFAVPNDIDGGSLLLYKVSYTSTLLFDTLLFILAVIGTGRIFRPKRLYESGTSIVAILFRDGSMLYAILTVSNLFNFIIIMLFFRGFKSFIFSPNAFFFVVSSGTNSEMTHTLSVVLVSRMIFNLREAGTEIYEGTEAWRSRVEREVMSTDMQFRVPTTVTDGSSDFVDDSGDNGGAGASELISA